MHASLATLIVLMGTAGARAATADDPFRHLATGTWIPAVDSTRVVRAGQWWPARHRYGAYEHLVSGADGASLTVDFYGTGLVLRLGSHAAPSYGGPSRGSLRVAIDDRPEQNVDVLSTPREVVLARGLSAGEHRARVVVAVGEPGEWVRVEGFFALATPSGDLALQVSGEESAYLVDVRATVRHRDRVVRDCLLRNWLTGGCRLSGLPPGGEYSLELRAAGWQDTLLTGISICAGQESSVPGTVFLKRDPRTRAARSRFPGPGHPLVRKPGEQLRARLVISRLQVDQLELVRVAGPATISRRMRFEEDTDAAFYYDREFVATVPADTPPGLYDLVASVGGASGASWPLRSPGSVHVLDEFPTDPMFMTWGHLDTWGQVQAEYLQGMAAMANLLAPDMVLVSNEVNPAYVSGALSGLEMPYVINFGNHQFEGHERWYGGTVGAVDFGHVLTVLNFGRHWHESAAEAVALLEERSAAALRVVNAFEHNAPVEKFLDRFGIALIHDGHGPGARVMELGLTPTLRAGKSNSESFRLIRCRDGRVESATYRGDDVAPYPFPRGAPAPVRVEYSRSGNGASGHVTNDLEESLPGCRLVFIMPHATYSAVGGRIQDQVVSDDGAWTVVRVRCDVPASGTLDVFVQPED